ncbi:MAG: aspartyl protease family protein [Kiritimatiellae bacterium]|nr:aspartyl protease family protein [Kiritimatiellia bacterium]
MKTKFAVCGILLATLAGMAQAALAENPFAPSAPPVAETAVPLSVRADNGMILVDAIAEGIPCRLIVDTGATHTTFDRAFVRNSLKRESVRPVEIMGETNVNEQPGFFELASFSLANASFGSFGAMAVDLSFLPATVGERVDGILGMNVLSAVPLVLSLRNATLTLNPSASALVGFDERGKTLVPEAVLFPVMKHRKAFPVLVDSGSSFTFFNTSHWPAAAAPSQENTATGINGSETAPRTPGIPGTFDKGPPLSLAPFIMDGREDTIGSDTLLRYDLYLSMPFFSFRPSSLQ